MTEENRNKIANTTSSVLGLGNEDDLDWRGNPIQKPSQNNEAQPENEKAENKD